MERYKAIYLRFGMAWVEAETEEEAKAKAESLNRERIDWESLKIPALLLYVERGGQ